MISRNDQQMASEYPLYYNKELFWNITINRSLATSAQMKQSILLKNTSFGHNNGSEVKYLLVGFRLEQGLYIIFLYKIESDKKII